ncbi:ATP-NAD kinase [Neocallimastix californiae]|jgi:NADH kinase|uniref:ATP-NAD kinase n=1 Tax=Neocallimastix californiae TaxID=1754190 RepID=A0A1Y2CSZ4_9FUNG|nr:ATP-NAD kinase [Neocallimastix californiae]|eukprot:ORY50168.1 ATP-NAD kinase [Neocallimastix californiae]
MSIQNKGYTWIANSILKKQFLSNGCTLNSHFNLIPSLLLKKELNNAYLGNLSFSRKYNSSTISKNRIFTESKSFIFEAVKNSNGTDIITNLGNPYVDYHLKWKRTPRTVLIVKKPKDNTTEEALIMIANWLHNEYPNINIIVEKEVADNFFKKLPFIHILQNKKEYPKVVDFVITLGGDGTILHTSSLFPKEVPPIISFSLGTLGFLLPYNIKHYKEGITNVIKGNVKLLLRMRIAVSIHNRNEEIIRLNDLDQIHAMNEVSLHRGRNPSLTSLKCSVDGEFFTNSVADGLIVATPTGSTAYSLSAGGPIVHPSVQSLLLTPICPRSLSFRPALLPPHATIHLSLDDKSRGSVVVNIDGKDYYDLNIGEYVQVQMSPYPIPCINQETKRITWKKHINSLLKWNQKFEGFANQLNHHNYSF